MNEEKRIPHGGTAFNSRNEVINYIDIIESILNYSFAQNGGVYINDTNLHTPDTNKSYIAIQAIEETTITTLSGNVDNMNGITLPAGVIVYGIFTNIELSSGSVVAYQS